MMRSRLMKYKSVVLIVSGLCIYCTILAHTKKEIQPADNTHFITFEHAGVELELCTCCLGVWFDAGELPLLVRRPDIAPKEFSLDNLLLLPDESVDEKTRDCPLCRKGMLKKAVSHHPLLVLDVCPCGAGVWVEGTEVSLINERLFQQDVDDSLTLYAGFHQPR